MTSHQVNSKLIHNLGYVNIIFLLLIEQPFFFKKKAQWDYFLYVGKICGVGWLLHYIPFCIMGRVTYLHHYFPALYFSILMAGFLLDRFTSTCNPKIKNVIFGICYILITGVFVYFKDITFGIDYPSSEYKGRKWLKTWNIV